MAQGDFLKGVEQTTMLRTLAKRTRQIYLEWMRKFIRFHRMKHPKEMGNAEVEAFLSDVVLTKNVSESTQNQAFSALMRLYTIYLESPLRGDHVHQEPKTPKTTNRAVTERNPTVSLPVARRLLYAWTALLWVGTPKTGSAPFSRAKC